DNVIDNSGVLNGILNLTATGQNNITNRAGAQINQITLDAPNNLINNEGTINSGILFTQDGAKTVNNWAGGIINGITATGNSADHIRNEGQINGAVTLGAGNDWYINLGGSENGSVDL